MAAMKPYLDMPNVELPAADELADLIRRLNTASLRYVLCDRSGERLASTTLFDSVNSVLKHQPSSQIVATVLLPFDAT